MSKVYKKTFLDKAIARVDFASGLPIKESLPQSIAREAIRRFPISEPKKLILGKVEFSKAGDLSAKKIDSQIEWNFHGKEREKTVCIASSWMWTIYKKYESFDVLKSDFIAVFNTLLECYEENIVIKRLGLRYINRFRLSDGDPTDWSGFFERNMLPLPKIVTDREKLSRAFHTIELNFGDERLKVQYGMHNPDFPATIRSREFVLDLDAFYEGFQDSNQIEVNLQKFHDHIAAFFEECITNRLRKEMDSTNE